MKHALAVALVVAAWPRATQAAPIELVGASESCWIFDDIDGSVENGNFFVRDPFYVAYGAIESGYLAVHPDDSQFIVVFTTWSLPGPVGALYQSVANDVEGIGYEHIAPLDAVIPEAIFDDTPNSQVQGFLHMNRWTNYIGTDGNGTDDTYISLVFGQELGHAWLAFVHVDAPAIDPRILLGRSDAHWNFYLDTGGSPAEGHAWTDNGDGTFTATPSDFFTFSDLDLYLMGLLPPEDVAPFFAIVGPHDCIDSAAKDGSCAPVDAFRFEAETYTVSGERVDLTVEDVIASDGVRSPAWPDAPTEYDVSFLLVKRPDEELGPEELAQLDAIVDRSVEIFNEQTRGLAEVVNRTRAEVPPGTEESGSGSEDATAEGGPTEGEASGTNGGPGSESEGGSASATAGATAGTVATVGETDGEGEGEDGDDGCGCRSSAEPPWLALLLLPMFRRRRT